MMATLTFPCTLASSIHSIGSELLCTLHISTPYAGRHDVTALARGDAFARKLIDRNLSEGAPLLVTARVEFNADTGMIEEPFELLAIGFDAIIGDDDADPVR